MTHSLLAAAALSLVACSTSVGGLVVTGQSRSLALNLQSEGTVFIQQSLSAANDLPFNQTLSKTADGSTLAASENSSFGNVGAVFVVSAKGNGTANVSDQGAEYTANSLLTLNLTLDQAAPYTATGSVTFAGVTATSELSLKLGTTSIFEDQIQDGVTTGTNPLQQSGILQPGNYTLLARVNDGFAGQISNETASFSLDLTVGSPGPASVPLPPAHWLAIGTLVPLAIALRSRRLSR